MRYSSELYAKSLFEILEMSKPSEHAGVISKFLKIVDKNGDSSRLRTIVASFEKMVIRSGGGKIVELSTAREIDKDLKDQLLKMFDRKDMIRVNIDPKLVAGVRVLLDEEMELDYSLARKFRKLFTVKI